MQAIGILIGMEDVPVAKQTDYLSSLLTPLCQQVIYACNRGYEVKHILFFYL